MLSKEHKNHQTVSDALDTIKQIGCDSLAALEHNQLAKFGELMHEHWAMKKKMSDKISNPSIDEAYALARENGASGGKLLGAGGGGFLMLYAEKNHDRIHENMTRLGLRRLHFRFDFEGSKALLNLVDSRVKYQLQQECNQIICPK